MLNPPTPAEIDPNKLYSVKELSEILPYSVKSLHRYIQQELLLAVKGGIGPQAKYLIQGSEVIRWLKITPARGNDAMVRSSFKNVY